MMRPNVTILRPRGAPASPGDRQEPAQGLLSMLLAEFRRALAAERRYEELAYGGPERLRAGIAPGEVARRTFEDVYADRVEPRREQAVPPVENERAAA